MKGQMKSIVAVIVVVASAALLAGPQPNDQFELVSTIAFSSTRQNPLCNPFLAAEIFLMSPNGTNMQRLTDSNGCPHADGMPVLSPDGKKIVFDSNRLTTNILLLPNGQPVLNISDLFVMDSDGTKLTFLTRGSSGTWSPDNKYVAFHASASYHASGGLITLPPIRTDPGAPTIDSDIFVANVDDVIAGAAVPKNITNSPEAIEEDADWSWNSTKIVFTRDPVPVYVLPGSNYPHKQIFTINADGTQLTQLTFDDYEQRAPAWSPDSSRIAFMCRLGGPDFEICVMDATNGANLVQLTNNGVFDGTPTWSPDGQKILFQRPSGLCPQLFVVDADTTCNANGCTCSAMFLGNSCETKLTNGVCDATHTPNFLGPHWGQLRVHIPQK
jgi:Tol biopolymer transport system component